MRPLPGLVGQLPYEFGSLSAQLLYDLYHHGSLPKDRFETKVIPLVPPPASNYLNATSQGGELKRCGYTCRITIAIAAFSTSMALTLLVKLRGAMSARAAKPLFLILATA